MIYQMNTFGFSSKGPFYILLLCFFFFLLHHLLFWSLKEQMDKFRLRALKEPHQNNCTKIRVDLIPCLLRLDDLNTCQSRAVHISMIWEKTPVDRLFKKIDVDDFNNLRPISTLLHISKLKERAVFAQPNFHSSSSGLHSNHWHQSAKTQSRSKHVESVTDTLMTMNGQYTVLQLCLIPSVR